MESESSCLQLSVGQKTYLIDQPLIYEIAHQICLWLGLADFELSIEFVTPEQMRELNRNYRQKDSSTDVLSFPQQEWEQAITLDQPYQSHTNARQSYTGPELLGDLVISPADAEANANQIGHNIDREVCFLLVHGILHLCGHDHVKADEEKLMTEQQQHIMAKLSDLKPQAIWNNCVRIK